VLLIKVEKKNNCLHILHWATESEKYILTLFYDQNYVNLSNLKFHPLCHTNNGVKQRFLDCFLKIVDKKRKKMARTTPRPVALYGLFIYLFFLVDHRATDFTLSKICGTPTKNTSHLSTVIFTAKRFVRAESCG
jgi:hypothetical protein